MGPSNEGVSDSDDYTIGNDGCTMISERSASPASPRGDTPRAKPSKSKKPSAIWKVFNIFVDDFDFLKSPEYADSTKKMIIDGRDVLSYRSEDIERMPLSDVYNLQIKLCCYGSLCKRGFWGFKMWRRRFFRMTAHTIQYFEVYGIL